MADTSIEWTDKVWNVTRGCRRVSPGCGGAKGEGGCYAERQANRFKGKGQPYEGLVTLGKQGPRWTGKGLLAVDKLDEPLHWRKPRRVFVNSMSDLFFEQFTNEEIAAVFGVMAACPEHTFQVLTKRAKRMREWFEWLDAERQKHDCAAWRCIREANSRMRSQITFRDGPTTSWPLPNVHLGVSAENQKYAEERIPELLRTPAAVRWVSYEPALGPVDFSKWDPGRCDCEVCSRTSVRCTASQHPLDWIVVGGESGPGARPFDIGWARLVIAQGKAADVKVFVKQLGAHPFYAFPPQAFPEDPSRWHAQALLSLYLKDRKGGTMSEWPEDLRVQEYPRT